MLQYCPVYIIPKLKECKVVGLVCNVGLLLAALGPSFLDKGVGIGPTGTHLGLACAQTTPCLPSFGYMPMASKAAIKKVMADRYNMDNTRKYNHYF